MHDAVTPLHPKLSAIGMLENFVPGTLPPFFCGAISWTWSGNTSFLSAGPRDELAPSRRPSRKGALG